MVRVRVRVRVVGAYLGEGAYHRVGTLFSSSNSMNFHDFSMTLNSSTDTNSGVYVCHMHWLITCTPLYLTLSLPCYLNN